MSLDKTLETILRSECAHLGTQFTSRGGSTVVAQPSGRRLFAKIESSVEQTVGEAESLKAMGAALSDDDGKGGEGKLTPEVHASGKSDDGRAYLITDYLDLKPSISRSGQKVLGQRLAEMHKRGVHPDGRFGFGVATYCGVTGDPELKDLEQQMRDRLGIMNMFGGFTRDFFDAYHAVIPRTEPYYNERLRLYELYHHLNHLLMFRGGYRSGAVSIMRSLIQFCDNVDDAK
uniref:protein-ribulosamine 3-kinase n=1 Tax=Kalmanozyma brasiliensis (strain GHG001) TaxID=1365824 RepID=V5F261_KALBG